MHIAQQSWQSCKVHRKCGIKERNAVIDTVVKPLETSALPISKLNYLNQLKTKFLKAFAFLMGDNALNYNQKKNFLVLWFLNLEEVTMDSIHVVLGTDVLGHGLRKEKNSRFDMVTI